ncbi:MAG: TonB-dependent receptor, partial [Gemmatimonadaceae bacterium]
MAAIACLIGTQVAAAQALGVVTGRVTDKASGQPIAAVSVTLEGTTNGTLTGDDGRYTLRQVAAGPHSLNFTRIGYEAGKLAVTVSDGAPATGNMTLTAAVMSLQAFVTTVTGPQRKIELGTTTAQINVAEKIAELPVNSMGTLLSGRAAGVQVSTSGAPGTGSRIRIRGQNSLSLNNDPLVYVDGIRVTTTGRTGLTTNSTGPSRLEDIAPSEIESIEIVKGPSAATLYGTEAANGVINITTKRGKSGKTVWSFFTENGLVQDPNEGSYPNQYYRWGTVVSRNAAGAVTSTKANTQCRLTQIAANLCTQQDSLGVHNLINDPVSTFITSGSRNNYGMQVSGGTDKVQFFLSGDTQNETGTYKMPDGEIVRLKAERGVTELPRWQTRPNTLDRVNLRANLSAQIAPTANIQLSTAYITSELQRPQNENNSTGLMVAALGGAGGNRFTVDSRGIPLYGGFNVVGDILSQQSQQQLKRFINSLSARWEVLPWLSARGTVGADIAEVNDFGGNLLQQGPIGNGRVGDVTSTRNQAEQYTVDLGSSATWRATSRFTNKLSAGIQYFRTFASFTSGNGNTLPPGGVTVTGAAQRLSSQGTSESITLGTYLEDQVSVNDRLFVTGGLRFDDNSAFGANFNGARYPKISVSWAISDEPWFKAPSLLNSMRIRSAYGAAGAAPGTNDALRYFNPTQVTLPG